VKRIILIQIISAFLLLGCWESPTQPNEVTAKVYVELLIAKEKYYADKDSLALTQDSIYKKYTMPKKEYEKNLSLIKYNSDDWNAFFKLAEAYLDTLKKADIKP
jgi:hypothetical protein